MQWRDGGLAIHSVSDVTKYIKGMFQSENVLQNVLIRGEISNFKRYASGHCYFTLKDAAASLKCVMFRSRAQSLRFEPTNGLSVVAAGNISVYERDGAYQLYTDSLMPEGAGALSLAFEQLKEKLTQEGMFAAEHKQKLPAFPKTIGVVTSVSGAVLRDIYHVAKRRNPAIRLVLYPVQVQGEDSARQVAEGIEFFNQKYPVDVLIVGRGGGSMEDLWSFNEEVVVRAIYASHIPLISAVGHETDYTLADFAGDVRAATPSQAAELAVPDTLELARYLQGLQARLQGSAQHILQRKRSQLEACTEKAVWRNPQQLLAERRLRLDRAAEALQLHARNGLQLKKHALQLQLEKLEMLNPLQVLLRGYSLVEKEKKIVKSTASLACGDTVRVVLADGSFAAGITAIEKGGRQDAKEKGTVL